MAKIDDGGRAFPIAYQEIDGLGIERTQVSSGMSLRDWFAGMALNQRRALSYGNWYATDAAREAYEIADAMIAARKDGSE